MTDADPIDTLITEFKKLKAEYDRYFQGLDRIPPTKSRDRFRKHFLNVMQNSGSHTLHTAQRFRLQSLQTTLTTHEAQWERICRQIEEGTYRRDRLRAERHAQNIEQVQNDSTNRPTHQEIHDHAASAPKAPQPIASPAPSSTTHAPAITQLHAAYVKAQQQLGNNNTMSIDALAQTVKEHMQATKQRTGCKSVACKVMIRNGETVLEFVPKD